MLITTASKYTSTACPCKLHRASLHLLHTLGPWPTPNIAKDAFLGHVAALRAGAPDERLNSKIDQLWAGAEPLSGRAALGFAILVPAVFYLGFSTNEPCLMLGLDGNWYRTMFAYEAVDRAPFVQTGVDALSGNFDAWYPLRPELLLAHSVALLLGIAIPNKAFIFVVFSMFLAAAIYVLGRSIQAPRAIALTAALLMPILAAAGLSKSVAQFFPLFEANPYWFQSTALGCLVIAAVWALDTKSPARTAALIAAPTLCLVLAVISLAPHVLFMVPIVAAYSAGSLLIARRVADVITRVLAGALAIAAAAALGIFTYYYGIIDYTAYRFFPGEIEHPLGGWMAMSVLFWRPLGAFVIASGIVGALWAAATGNGRLRMFAVTHLAATTAFFVIAYWLAFYAASYRSSWPIYFETGIWPIALLFSAIAVASVLKLVLRVVDLLAARLASCTAFAWAAAHSSALLLAGILVVITGYDLSAIAAGAASPCVATGFLPIRATPITRILQKEVALRPGAPFRGMVATIDAAQPGKPGDWITFFQHDYELWRETGNDHRTVGLWYFNIPTLFQYHTFVTPPYYLVLSEFLSSEIDQQMRSVIVMTHIKPALMALWGVRYVITDDNAAPGHEVAKLSTAHSGMLRLLELANPNLGNYSPVQVTHAATFADALKVMHQPDFDGSRRIITDAPIEQPLTPAIQVQLVYTHEGLRLTAQSAGHSVLVLPVQYSHCWTAVGSGQPQLFRADAMQLGVSFTGRLDARLIFRLGPILAGSCRVDDVQDMDRLRIRQARVWAR